MGFRFRYRLKILPGFYLNFGKRGVNSLSAKAGPFTTNFSREGVKHTAGLHGTGLSYETKKKAYPKVGAHIFWFVLITLVVLYFLS